MLVWRELIPKNFPGELTITLTKILALQNMHALHISENGPGEGGQVVPQCD